jgi:hypothetical protein
MSLLQGIASSASTAGQLLVADGKEWSPVSVSGALTLSGSGVATLSDHSVTNIKLATAPAGSMKYADQEGNIQNLPASTVSGDFADVLTWNSAGNVPYWAQPSKGFSVQTITTSGQIQPTSGYVWTNKGSNDAATLTIGLGAIGGEQLQFVVMQPYPFTIATSGTEVIYTNDASSTVSVTEITGQGAVGNIYSTLTLLCLETGIWVITSRTGSWTYTVVP